MDTLKIAAGALLVIVATWVSLGFLGSLGYQYEMKVFGRPFSPVIIGLACLIIVVAAVAVIGFVFKI